MEKLEGEQQSLLTLGPNGLCSKHFPPESFLFFSVYGLDASGWSASNVSPVKLDHLLRLQ